MNIAKNRKRTGKVWDNLVYYDELGFEVMETVYYWDDWNDHRDGQRNPPKTKEEKQKIIKQTKIRKVRNR